MTTLRHVDDSRFAWLIEQVAIDEKTARDATEGPWRWAHLPGPAKYGLVGLHHRLIVSTAIPDVYPSKFDATHIERWSPEQVIADCEYKRQVINLHRHGGEEICLGDRDNPAAWAVYCVTCGSGEGHEYPTWWPCDTLKLMARPYRGRPGYREEDWSS